MLNNIVLLRKIQINYCRIPESPYICTVFFIVLDLRLTKVGARRCSFFMPIYLVLPLFGQIYEIKPTKVIVDGSDTILSLYNKAFVEVMVLLNLDYMDIKR